MGTLVNYTYTGKDGYTYSGQVVSDPTVSKYNYQPGQTYAAPGGTYKIDTTPGTTTNAPSGSVYQTSYVDKATGKTYSSWHYDLKDNKYYDIGTSGYDKSTGLYTPTGGTPIPAWSSKEGLGSEYAYVKADNGTFHAYGGGGTNALITPSTIGATVYDYKFLYPDKTTYYLGRVVDDGTFGYKVGTTIPKAGGGEYSIYAVDPAKPAADAVAGWTYTGLWHETAGDYPTADALGDSPYYNKPVGTGGLGTEHDWVKKPGGYYAFDSSTVASTSQPVATLPLPT